MVASVEGAGVKIKGQHGLEIIERTAVMIVVVILAIGSNTGRYYQRDVPLPPPPPHPVLLCFTHPVEEEVYCGHGKGPIHSTLLENLMRHWDVIIIIIITFIIRA